MSIKEFKAVKNSDGSITIVRDGVELLLIEEFADRTHPGHHLFIEPLNDSYIVRTDGIEVSWTHELLKG